MTDPTTPTPESLRLAASWIDEEYRVAAVMHDAAGACRGTSDGLMSVGRMQALACVAGSLRSWAATGREPQHAPTSMQKRDEYAAELRRDHAD